jgi:hypothetical protein
VKSLASVSVAALLIGTFATAGEPTARAPVPTGTPQPDDQDRRPERPVSERYAQIRAECEAQLATYRQAAA